MLAHSEEDIPLNRLTAFMIQCPSDSTDHQLQLIHCEHAQLITRIDARYCVSSNRESVMPDFDYDLLVIGSGPAGQRAAIQAAKLGKRVAIVERKAVVGGMCINTGTIPSKTL